MHKLHMHHKVPLMPAEPTKPFTEKLKAVANGLGISCASELPEPPKSRTAKKIWEGTLSTNHQDMAGKLWDGLKSLAEGGVNYKKPGERKRCESSLQALGTKDTFLRLAAEQYRDNKGYSSDKQTGGRHSRTPAEHDQRVERVAELYADYTTPAFHAVRRSAWSVVEKWHLSKDDIVAFFFQDEAARGRVKMDDDLFSKLSALSDFLGWWTVFASELQRDRLCVASAHKSFDAYFEFFHDFLREFVAHFEAQPAECRPTAPFPWQGSIPRLLRFFPPPTRGRDSRVSPIPALGNLLPSPNAEFFGFTAWLVELGELFSKNGSVALGHAAAIKGDGGVGKTELATEFAHRCLADGTRKTVLWCRAETEGNFDEDLAKHAEALGAPPELKDKAQQMRFTLEWLKKNRNWLLVADNADEVAARNHVAARLKERANGWLLVTTKLRDPGREFSKVEIVKLTPEEAADFLMQCVQGKGSKDEAMGIARELDCLFLALAWAVGELRESGDTFAQLLTRYRAEPLDVLRNLPQGWGDRKPVLKCWLTSYSRLSPLARRLLHVMGWFAPDRIAEKWLVSSGWFASTPAAKGLKFPPTKAALEDALRELHARRFCTRDGETLSMHRLVQLSAQTELLAALPKKPALKPQDFLASAVDLLLHNAPPTGDNSWQFMEWIDAHPHAEALSTHIRAKDLRSAQAARLWFALAQAQRRLKRLSDSLASYRVAVKMADVFLTSDSDAHEVARWHNAAACAACQLQAYPAARKYMANVRAFTNRAVKVAKTSIEKLVCERRYVCHNACTALHWSYELATGTDVEKRAALEKEGLESRERQLELSTKLRTLRAEGEASSLLQAFAEAGDAYRQANKLTRAKDLARSGFAEFRRMRETIADWQHLESGISGFVNSTKHLAGLLFEVGMLEEACEAVEFVLEKVPALGGNRNTDAHSAQLLWHQIKHAKKPARANIAAAKECVATLQARLEPNDRTLKRANDALAEMQRQTKSRPLVQTPTRKRTAKRRPLVKRI